MVLTFSTETVETPVTYTLIKEYDILINILNADISHGREGNLLIEMTGEKGRIKEALAYLESIKVAISPVIKTILFKESECIHCGSCTSVCFTEALVMGPADRELKFSPEKCVACELCIKACPLRLFELNFGVN
jgi:ferredoxin